MPCLGQELKSERTSSEESRGLTTRQPSSSCPLLFSGQRLIRSLPSLCFRAKREYVSFDSPNSAAAKARYVRSNGLGGLMYWELDADLRPADPLAPHALVPIVTEEMGGIARHVASNCLEYPWSRFDNVKNGMA